MKNKGRLHPDCPWETGRTPPQRKICSSTWGQFCIVLTWRKIVFSKYPMWDLASQSMAMLASCCMIRDRHYCLTCKALWTGYVKYNSQGHSGRIWQWSDVTMTVHCVRNTLINIRIWILLSNYLPSPQKEDSCYLLVLAQMIFWLPQTEPRDYTLYLSLLFSASWIWQWVLGCSYFSISVDLEVTHDLVSSGGTPYTKKMLPVIKWMNIKTTKHLVFEYMPAKMKISYFHSWA